MKKLVSEGAEEIITDAVVASKTTTMTGMVQNDVDVQVEEDIIADKMIMELAATDMTTAMVQNDASNFNAASINDESTLEITPPTKTTTIELLPSPLLTRESSSNLCDWQFCITGCNHPTCGINDWYKVCEIQERSNVQLFYSSTKCTR